MEKNLILVSSFEELKTVIASVMKEIPKEKPIQSARKRLTRTQAALLIGISYHTIGAWVRSGKIQERGFGRKKFFYEDELIEMLNTQDQSPK